jgi:hypothetical protein
VIGLLETHRKFLRDLEDGRDNRITSRPIGVEFLNNKMQFYADLKQQGTHMRIAIMFPLIGMLTLVAVPLTAQSAPRSARSVVVPSNVAWTYTPIKVRRGQWLRFEPSGEIWLSFNRDDVTVAAGMKSGRKTEKAPIPSVSVGALIGRVNSGKPFPIGDTTQPFQMPANGTLYLGVNDDYVADNSGNYVVKVWEP